MTEKNYQLHTEWSGIMINSTSGLIVLLSERRFTSAGLAVRLPFTHFKKGIIFSCSPLLHFRLSASSLAVLCASTRGKQSGELRV